MYAIRSYYALGIGERPHVPDLDLDYHQLSEADLDLLLGPHVDDPPLRGRRQARGDGGAHGVVHVGESSGLGAVADHGEGSYNFV